LSKNESSLIDLNGKTIVDFGKYEELHFLNDGLIRAMKKGKFGFVDKKLNIIIPFKYTFAEDFNDKTTIVSIKESNLIIDLTGNEIYKTSEAIKRIHKDYFLVGSENKILLNKNGIEIMKDIQQFEIYNNRLLVITLNNNTIKIINL
jgi:hypothetical protein